MQRLALLLLLFAAAQSVRLNLPSSYSFWVGEGDVKQRVSYDKQLHLITSNISNYAYFTSNDTLYVALDGSCVSLRLTAAEKAESRLDWLNEHSTEDGKSCIYNQLKGLLFTSTNGQKFCVSVDGTIPYYFVVTKSNVTVQQNVTNFRSTPDNTSGFRLNSKCLQLPPPPKVLLLPTEYRYNFVSKTIAGSFTNVRQASVSNREQAAFTVDTTVAATQTYFFFRNNGTEYQETKYRGQSQYCSVSGANSINSNDPIDRFRQMQNNRTLVNLTNVSCEYNGTKGQMWTNSVDGPDHKLCVDLSATTPLYIDMKDSISTTHITITDFKPVADVSRPLPTVCYR